MDVRMKQEILAPRVQDGEESDLGSKMLGIGGDLRQRPRHGPEQQVIEFGRILPDQRVEQMGQCEHDVKVAGKCCRQHLPAYVLLADMWSSPRSTAT